MTGLRWNAARRAGAAALVLAGAILLPATPAHASADCGGPDTPPARYIANGNGCGGSFEGEGTPSGPWGIIDSHDEYEFDATVDDLVTLEFTNANCRIHAQASDGYPFAQRYGDSEPERYSYFASYTGRHPITIHYHVSPSFSPGPESAPPGLAGAKTVPGAGTATYHDCWEQPLTYTIKVTVVANTRPAITSITGPTSVPPGGGGTYTISATDPDGDLAYLRAKWGVIDAWNPVSGSSASTSWSFTFDTSTSIRFAVRDAKGFEVSQNYSVAVVQNDCGTGGDIGVRAMSFPFDCTQAHLWPPMLDSTDSFTFEVPSGVERVYAGYNKVSGDLSARVTLTPPGGTAVGKDNGGFAVAAVAGTWRLDVTRLAGKGAYTLSAGPAGAPAPPAISASAPASVHAGEALTLGFTATDPNNQRVFYLIDWKDGSALQRIPWSGTAASGAPQSASRTYYGSSPTVNPVVTAQNDDGLTASATTSTTLIPENDCGYGAGYDAPDRRGSSAALKTMLASCTGDLGYWIPIGAGVTQLDGGDSYRFSRSDGARVTFDLETAPGTSATIEVYLGGLRWTGTNTVTIPATAPLLGYIVSVFRTGGKGSYTLTMTATPPV